MESGAWIPSEDKLKIYIFRITFSYLILLDFLRKKKRMIIRRLGGRLRREFWMIWALMDYGVTPLT